VVLAAGGRYALPQDDVEEVVHVAAPDVAARVDHVSGAGLLRLRGSLLPLVNLGEQLGHPAPEAAGPLLVLVAQSRGRRYGLVVDAVAETTEAVVKPLPAALRAVGLYAGVTILADGHACLVLDVVGLATAAGVQALRPRDSSSHDAPESAGQTTPAPGTGGVVPDRAPAASVLVASGTDGGLLAFPIDVVHRLERCATGSVSREGHLELLPYGAGILPLVRVNNVLRAASGYEPEPKPESEPEGPESGATVPVVVCVTEVGLVGFVVGTIEDVVPRPSAPTQPGPRVGVTARLMLDEGVAELVDVDALVRTAGVRSLP